VRLEHRDTAWVLTALLLGAAACTGQGTPARFSGAGGIVAAGGAGGEAGLDGAAPEPDAAETTDAPPPEAPPQPLCNEAPTVHVSKGVMVSLPIEPVLAGKPFIFGEPNDLPAGGTILALNLRFYVSHVALLTATGASVPVDLVDATDTPEPFGVHLFVAEEAPSQVLRVRVPPGAYAGVSFMLGLDPDCNSPAQGRKFPLNDQSQMTWPHTLGYLFLRFEDQVAAGDAGASTIPPQIHMGGLPGGALPAPTVKIMGTLTPGAPLERKVGLDIGSLLDGAQADADPAMLLLAIPTPDVQAGERLRQHVPDLPLFTFAP
jgi:hypothetical protein